MFERPRPRGVDAWLARSRRQKSRNPERNRAGKREDIGNIHQSVAVLETSLNVHAALNIN